MRPSAARWLLGLGCSLIVASVCAHVLGPGRTASGAPLAESPTAAPDTEPEAVAGEPAPADAPAPPGDDAESGVEPAATNHDAEQPDPAGRPGAPARPDEPDVSAPIAVTVPRGASADTIAQLLTDAGIVPDKTVFLRLVAEKQASRRLQFGTYHFAPDEALEAIVERLLVDAEPEP